jgi:hypothetical protein
MLLLIGSIENVKLIKGVYDTEIVVSNMEFDATVITLGNEMNTVEIEVGEEFYITDISDGNIVVKKLTRLK